MKKSIFITLLLIVNINVAQNTLLNGDFWKKNPSVASVKTEIANGNNPSEANRNNFDVVTLAINNNAPLETILFLLKQDGNSVDKLTHDGRIYLHWAAYKGNVELVKHLIEQKSDINRTDDKGAIPIAFAASSGMANPKVYELFFNAGNNPKQKFKNGTNLLLLSIANDNELKLADYLVSKGLSYNDRDDLGNTVFNYAARNGDVKLLQTLHKKGIKYDGRALVIASQGSRNQSTTLEGYKYLVEELKINANSVGDNGENVLHNLVRKPNQDEIIAYFITKGADVNLQDKEGKSVLMNATRGNVAVVKTFLPKIKDINVTNKKGQSALTFAIEDGSPEMVDFLLTNGAKTSVLDNKGNNLAYYLIESYRAGSNKFEDFDKKAALLKKANFDLNTPQKDGNTLYHLAVSKNDLNLLLKIEKMGISVNAINNQGMTVLHKAALIAKDDTILKYLIEKGAKKDSKTEFDETAYDLAKENEFLIENNIAIDFLK